MSMNLPEEQYMKGPIQRHRIKLLVTMAMDKQERGKAHAKDSMARY